MILCVIGISRNVAHPVALGQVKSIAIHRIDLLMTGSICGLDQLTCFCVALVIIGISEAVAIGIHHSNQQVSIIGQANTASHAISYLADIAATVLKGETAGGIGDLLKLPTGIAEGNGISIEIASISRSVSRVSCSARTLDSMRL